MTAVPGILSNCGDFLPGTEPRASSPVGNTTSPTYNVVIENPIQVFQIPVIPENSPPVPTQNPGYIIPNHYIDQERTVRDVANSTEARVRTGNLLQELESAATSQQSTTSVTIAPIPNLALTSVFQILPDTVYSPYYNFYNTSPAPNTGLVSNNRYPNIFASLIAYEVSYFLDRQGTTLSWSEFDINNLTPEKVAISLNRNLFVAFNNIHNGLNTKIDSEVFYNVVKSHLVQGTISEFDPNVFINTYERQKGDTLFEPPAQVFPASLAPVVFQEESVNPNYESESVSIETSDAYKRMRFLPEDIGAYVSVQQIDGELYQLPITNEGIPTSQLNV